MKIDSSARRQVTYFLGAWRRSPSPFPANKGVHTPLPFVSKCFSRRVWQVSLMYSKSQQGLDCSFFATKAPWAYMFQGKPPILCAAALGDWQGGSVLPSFHLQFLKGTDKWITGLICPRRHMIFERRFRRAPN